MDVKIRGVNVALGIIFNNAYDMVPLCMVMATLRRMGVREAEVRMVEEAYEEPKE